MTIWVGIFPMRVNFWLALSSTIFYAANLSVLYHFKKFSCAPCHTHCALVRTLGDRQFPVAAPLTLGQVRISVAATLQRHAVKRACRWRCPVLMKRSTPASRIITG